MDRMPIRLARPPIVEATAEVRFSSERPDLGSLLPGLMYAKLSDVYPTSQNTGIADLPAALRVADPNLRYAFTNRLLSTDGKHYVGVCARALGIASAGAYPGWLTFRERVACAWKTLFENAGPLKVERVSIKYVNLIQVEHGSDLSKFAQLQLTLGGRQMTSENLQIRCERREGALVFIVAIVSHAAVGNILGQTPRKGMIIDLDVISEEPVESNAEACLSMLDLIHEREKGEFFDLLNPETIESYGPDY